MSETGMPEDDNPDRVPDDPRAAQDELIIECLAAGMSYPQASEIAGCTARTISRRMSDRNFARRVSRRRGERLQVVTGQLTALADDAVAELRQLVLSAERDSDRLRAIQLVLTFTGRFRTDTDLEDRLNDLERQLEDPSDNEQETAP